MKKLKLLTFSVLGFSLALGGVAAFASAPKAKSADAATEIIYANGKNLISSSSTSTDPAWLDKSDPSKYVLTLNGYNSSSLLDLGTAKTNIAIINISLPLTIKIKGTVTLTNNDSTYGSNYGIYAVGITEGVDLNINFVGDGSSPKLNITTPNKAAESYGLYYYASRWSTSGVSFSNLEVNVSTGKAPQSRALDVDNANFVVNSGAKITATSAGSNATATDILYCSAGIYAGTYVQAGGTVKATGGASTGTGYSYGLYAGKGDVSINNGRLEAKGGNTETKSTTGIYAVAGNVNLNVGAEVVASAGSISNAPADTEEVKIRSYGIEIHVPTSKYLNIGSLSNYLYATTASNRDKDFGINLNIVASYAGYASNSNIFTDDNRVTIVAGSHLLEAYKQFIFQRVQYSATASTPVTYDEGSHVAISVAVTYPTSATVEYRLKGSGDDWSTTVPEYTNANEDGYKVEYRISKSEFVPIIGEVSFIIHKADSSVATIPVIHEGFEADGETLKPLVEVEGVCEDGTIMYSVNGGEYSAEAPKVKYAGTYEISYKVVGDENHNDIAPVSIGTVVVTGVEPPVPTPPTPDPDTPTDPTDPVTPTPGGGESDAKKGLAAGAIIGIVLGSVAFVLVAAYLVLFLLLNKWIRVEDKAVRVMRFALGHKDGKARYLRLNFKFAYREKHEVFNSKQDALK